MPDITIIRGDSYSLRRPLFTYTLVDINGDPFDLSGCTVRTTYKPNATTLESDPNDEEAAIKHQLVVGANGVVTSQNGLFLKPDALSGVVEERLTSAETASLPAGVALLSDLELTDANGEVFTWLFTDWLQNIEGITNRTV